MEAKKPLYIIVFLKKAYVFSCRVNINTAHPVLQGHFPGRPVMPGAWLVTALHDIAEDIIGKELVMIEIQQVKFLRPFLPLKNPEADIHGEVTLFESGRWKVIADIIQNNNTIVKFTGMFVLK